MASHNTAQGKMLKTMPLSCKAMGNVFWGDKGRILVEFLPEMKIINAPRYHHTLMNLCHALSDEYPGRKNHPATQQCTAPQCSSVHGGFRGMAGDLSPIHPTF
jgi:hypothetical protein